MAASERRPMARGQGETDWSVREAHPETYEGRRSLPSVFLPWRSQHRAQRRILEACPTPKPRSCQTEIAPAQSLW